MLFLAFLLYAMASKGIGGFTHYEARLPIDFAASDLFLDPATLRGPDAAQTVARRRSRGNDLEGRDGHLRPVGSRIFGDAAANKLGDAIVANPDILTAEAPSGCR